MPETDERHAMTEIFVCDPIRTPIGSYGGDLAGVCADDLAAVARAALLQHHASVDWARLGCASQAGEFRL